MICLRVAANTQFYRRKYFYYFGVCQHTWLIGLKLKNIGHSSVIKMKDLEKESIGCETQRQDEAILEHVLGVWWRDVSTGHVTGQLVIVGDAHSRTQEKLWKTKCSMWVVNHCVYGSIGLRWSKGKWINGWGNLGVLGKNNLGSE